jgi:hypothetical protein
MLHYVIYLSGQSTFFDLYMPLLSFEINILQYLFKLGILLAVIYIT